MRTMRKYIWISLLFLIGCGVREKKTNYEKENISNVEKKDSSQNTDFNSYAESKTDLNQYMQEIGLKINSTGNPYTLQYNGVIFSGDANIDFNNKQSKNIIKTITKTKTTYKSQTTYKSITKYKSNKINKVKESKSKRDSWWLYVLLYSAGLATIPLLKYFIKK